MLLCNSSGQYIELYFILRVTEKVGGNLTWGNVQYIIVSQNIYEASEQKHQYCIFQAGLWLI